MQAELYQLTPEGKLSFRLHSGQARAWRSRRRFVFVIAGTQGGKTSFVPLWLDREIREQGHGDYLAATATYDLFKLKFLPEMRRYFVTLMGWNEDKSDRVFWREYKPRMFDRIILRSAASEGGLESATAKAAALDECGQDDFRITAWEAVQRRLSLSQGRVLGTTTPYNLGWLKQEIFDRWRNGESEYHVVQFRSIDNPAFPRAEYERMKSRLPAWKFEMFYNGNFTRPAGLIYEDFIDAYREEGGHKVHPFNLPPEWPRFGGLDFGPVHTARILLAKDPALNVYYLYSESLEGGKTSPEHADAAKKAVQGTNIQTWTGGAGSEDQYRWDWRAAGVTVREPCVKEVELGIDRVIALLKARRLFVFDTCKGILDEMGIYGRVLDDYGQATDKIKDKENFHFLDALRYDVVGLETPSGASLIALV
jgi:hypothetical protein